MQSFKYLCINVTSTNMWRVHYESKLHAGWNSYYMFENQHNQSDTWDWEVRLMLFHAMVGPSVALQSWRGSQPVSRHAIRNRSSACKEYTNISQKSRIIAKTGAWHYEWFKRWEVKDILELSGDAMKYVIIEDRLLESLRMKWQDDKLSNLKLRYFIFLLQWLFIYLKYLRIPMIRGI